MAESFEYIFQQHKANLLAYFLHSTFQCWVPSRKYVNTNFRFLVYPIHNRTETHGNLGAMAPHFNVWAAFLDLLPMAVRCTFLDRLL